MPDLVSRQHSKEALQRCDAACRSSYCGNSELLHVQERQRRKPTCSSRRGPCSLQRRLQASQQALVFGLWDTVETSCKVLKGVAIDDRNAATGMRDPAAGVEPVERRGHAGSAGAKHQGTETHA